MGAAMRLVGKMRFNPRAREGRDLVVTAAICITTSFNPRAREGRDADAFVYGISGAGFNPRAREGRDPPRQQVSYAHRVSIRAPVRGATTGERMWITAGTFQSARP